MDPKSTPDVTPQPAVPTPPSLPVLDVPADVTVEDADEIRAYLAQYPELIPVVRDMCGEARRQLGDETELIVRMNRDPEIHDPYVKILARFPRYEKGVMDRIDRVRRLFDEVRAASDGWVHLTTDFRRTRGRDAV